MCQICNNNPQDYTLAPGIALTFGTLIQKQNDKLCADDTGTTIKNALTSEMIVRASLQVLVLNPTNCYFTFFFGNIQSPVSCLVSGYNITGGHYTEGSCEAMGKLGKDATTAQLIVKVGAAQGSWPCTMRYMCLSAMEIPS
jgi:hypothetical protein